jgi:hypothetical protein
VTLHAPHATIEVFRLGQTRRREHGVLRTYIGRTEVSLNYLIWEWGGS